MQREMMILPHNSNYTYRAPNHCSLGCKNESRLGLRPADQGLWGKQGAAMLKPMAWVPSKAKMNCAEERICHQRQRQLRTRQADVVGFRASGVHLNLCLSVAVGTDLW